jgi:hypothetical protein
MVNFETLEEQQRENHADRLAFVKQWARFVREHDDETWSRQQNVVVDSQLQSARQSRPDRSDDE